MFVLEGPSSDCIMLNVFRADSGMSAIAEYVRVMLRLRLSSTEGAASAGSDDIPSPACEPEEASPAGASRAGASPARAAALTPGGGDIGDPGGLSGGSPAGATPDISRARARGLSR